MLFVTCLTAIAIAVFTSGIQAPWPWVDEGATYTALWRGWGQLLLLLRGPDAPLVPYYVIAKGWVLVVQAGWPAVTTLMALRLLSAAAATGTVLVLYVLVARNAGRFAGLLSGLVLVNVPGFSRFAQEARGYTLLALATTVSWLALDYWLTPGRDPVVVADQTAGLSPVRRALAGSVRATPYTASLVVVAVIHTFGIFQWPAHALATLTSPPLTHRSRLRRVLSLGGIMLVAAAVAASQVVFSVRHGTGPVAPDAFQHPTAWQLLTKVSRAITVSPTPAASAVLLGLVLIGALLALRGQNAPFSRSLVIWLLTPLLLELSAAFVRTNLFRIRYWITILPPLAALAGLGAAAIATAVARVLESPLDRFGKPAGSWWLSRAAAALVTVTVLAVQVALALPAQAGIRSPAGHGQNLTGILGVIARIREANPGIRILVPGKAAAGIFASVDPTLQLDNPLRHFDPRAPTVFTTPTAQLKVQSDLALSRRLLWVYQAPLDIPADDRVPQILARLDLTVTSVSRSDLGWTALVLERPRATG
ncbi:MAG: hypothetical protein ACOH1Y_13020 [Propionicimonas sp.]